VKTLTIVAEHSSGLHSVEPAELRAALVKQLVDLPDFLSLTEMMSEARAAVLHQMQGYDVVRVTGGEHGADECALLVKVFGGRFRVVSFRAVRLTELPIPRRNGAFDFALVVELEDVHTGARHTRIVIHRPSGVDGPHGLLDNAQGRVYADGTEGLRRLVAGINGPVVITGDWNLSLRGWVREYLHLHFPDFAPTWPVGELPHLGTLGVRVIDFSLVRGFDVVEGEVVSSFGASDHRAVRETHKETAVPQRMLTDLADVLRAGGLTVVEIPGWKARTRPASTGGFAPAGNLWHHTGASDRDPHSMADDFDYAVWLATKGRNDLPPSLCQVSVGRDGTCYVCAAGRANHAGKAKASGPIPAGDGNELYVGWECQNNGTEGWSPEQYEAMVIGGAATSRHYAWGARANRAHKETSVTGKWDPGALDMDRFRADIAARMRKGEDWFDMATKDDLKAALREVLEETTFSFNEGKVELTLGQALSHLETEQDRIKKALKDKG